MLTLSQFSLTNVRWIKLDPDRVTFNSGPSAANPNNEVWAPNPDLSKVDEVGFADLMPGSGHGTGGYIQLGDVEFYGKPVPRSGALYAAVRSVERREPLRPFRAPQAESLDCRA